MRSRTRLFAAATALALLPLTAAAAEVSPAPPGEVPQVLAPFDPASGTGPSAAGLSAALADLIKAGPLGGSRGLAVLDVASGQLLYGADPDRPITPASTTKTLTAAAALSALGPDTVLHTKVVRSLVLSASASAAPTPVPGVPAPPAEITLVGGGDPLLSSLPAGSSKLPAYPRRASLDDLAAQTAKNLAGVSQVKLRYDAGIFSGPAASPNWERSYTGDVVGPVMGLEADQGRLGPTDGGRVNDPALHSAQLFAKALVQHGVTVVGAPTAASAQAGAPTIGDVASPPVSAILEHMLVESDNDVAEAMARQVAIARGKPATFVDGAAAVLEVLTSLGINVSGVTLHDGSGLSRDDRIPPSVIAHVLALAAGGAHPELRPLVAGLSIAGTNGTLAGRFNGNPASAARGVLRGKSGYLTGVVSLSGLIIDASGRLLAFDVAADAVKPGFGLAVKSTWDKVAGTLAKCGCS